MTNSQDDDEQKRNREEEARAERERARSVAYTEVDARRERERGADGATVNQREYLREMGVDDVEPFRFPRTDRKRLLEVLGGREHLVKELELQALDYKISVRYWTDPSRKPPRRKAELQRDLRTARDGADRLLEMIRKSEYVKASLLGSVLYVTGIDTRSFELALELIKESAMEDPALTGAEYGEYRARKAGAPKD